MGLCDRVVHQGPGHEVAVVVVDDALVQRLAQALGVSQASVNIARGRRSQMKLVKGSGMTNSEVEARLSGQAREASRWRVPESPEE